MSGDDDSEHSLQKLQRLIPAEATRQAAILCICVALHIEVGLGLHSTIPTCSACG